MQTDTRKLKYFKFLIFVSFLLIVYSCEYLDETRKYKQINSNSDFEFTVNTVETRNGFILNDEYYCPGGYFLQTDANFPRWILDEMDSDQKTGLFYEDGQMLLAIWKIKPPFVIHKKAHSNILYLIKNNNELRFRID